MPLGKHKIVPLTQKEKIKKIPQWREDDGLKMNFLSDGVLYRGTRLVVIRLWMGSVPLGKQNVGRQHAKAVSVV